MKHHRPVLKMHHILTDKYSHLMNYKIILNIFLIFEDEFQIVSKDNPILNLLTLHR